MEQIQQQPEPTRQEDMSISERAKYVLGTSAVTGLGAAAMGFGEFSILLAAAGGVAGCVFSDTMRNFLVDHAPAPRKARSRKSKVNWWLTGQIEPESLEDDDPLIDVSEDKRSAPLPTVSRNDDIFALENAIQPLPCSRITMTDIIAHIPANSYRVWLGRDVTRPGMPAVSVNILRQHIKLIGASQKGKSSMAACILDQIRRTHDLAHVLIAILDLENRTGKLFANDPHIVTFDMGGQRVKMHARTKEQVLEYLGYLVKFLDWRYSLDEAEVEQQPLVVVYLEEFLSLKDHFKRLAPTSKAAQSDYDNLIYSISELARRGLKARIQLLLCAQVEYRDEDLAEALANITAGMSFCVKQTAAQAAGFIDAELLKRNRKENIIGQAVAEFADCRGLVLAPEYDLRQKLLDLSAVSSQSGQSAPFSLSQDDFQADSDRQSLQSEAKNGQILVSGQEDSVCLENVLNEPGDSPDCQTDDRLKYRFTETEIAQFVAAYRVSGSIEKVLSSMKKGAGYKPHARDILQVFGLRS